MRSDQTTLARPPPGGEPWDDTPFRRVCIGVKPPRVARLVDAGASSCVERFVRTGLVRS